MIGGRSQKASLGVDVALISQNTASVDIQISPTFSKRITRSWISRVMKQIVGEKYRSQDIEISVVITDDEVMKNLNLKFMGYDETTDVLAFPMEDKADTNTETYIQFPSIYDHNTQLGEIIISYPQAKRQASLAKKTIKSELLLLLVHGFLHLLGYDHAYPVEKEDMWRKQDEIIATISVN
mgnify:CR=1 FL=1